MIGVVLTSTCWYEGVDRQTFTARVEELVNCVHSVQAHIRQPYELIIADNSPRERLPTEQILALCPENTSLIRNTRNPGKDAGEAQLTRDGIYLSAARGHRWTFKLTGRYFIEGDWSIDDGVALLEKSGKKMLAKLIGKPMGQMKLAQGHPLMEGNREKILGGVASQAFIADPAYLVERGVFQNDYFYRSIPWVNFEQTFRHALNGLAVLHWPHLPVGGWAGNRHERIPIQLLINASTNPVFEQAEDCMAVPVVDISPLLGN